MLNFSEIWCLHQMDAKPVRDFFNIASEGFFLKKNILCNSRKLKRITWRCTSPGKMDTLSEILRDGHYILSTQHITHIFCCSYLTADLLLKTSWGWAVPSSGQLKLATHKLAYEETSDTNRGKILFPASEKNTHPYQDCQLAIHSRLIIAKNSILLCILS